MPAIDDLKKIVDEGKLAQADKLKKQLDLMAQLPGQYNQQVFDKLLELAKYDAKAIPVFIENFIKTVLQVKK
jgi:uncharacterized protein YbaP (TraB family)